MGSELVIESNMERVVMPGVVVSSAVIAGSVEGTLLALRYFSSVITRDR